MGRAEPEFPPTFGTRPKLSGYDTLRLILADKAILVEGPSDELVVQKAYKQKHGKLPLENGVDVISVRGLSFKRFLEIGKLLELDIRVVTDNDGKLDALKEKYKDYLDEEVTSMLVPWDRINFIQIRPSGEVEEVVSFVR